jgi:hypothetical protein
MRPRATPLRGLAASLRGFAPAAKGVRALEADLADPLGLHYAILDRTPGGETLVLLVDQLEEALSAAGDERDTFFARLQEAVAAPDSRLLVILTLRSDFLTACLELPSLAGLLRDGLHPLGVLDRAALRRAIVLPAAQTGVGIDGAFVEEVLDDTVDGRALPLLTDALARLWPVLLGGDVEAYTAAYRASGRVTGGLAHRADRIYRDGGREAQSSLQAALLALAEVDEDGRIRRRRVPKKELPQAADAALEQFVAARLLVAFEEEGVKYVDVAHEALFASWPLYARWLADAEAHLKLSRRLEQDAREWVNSGESSLHLWTGERLAAGQTMLEDARFAADHPARRFLAVSIANDRRMQEREANLIAARIDAEHLRLPVASLLAAAAAVKRYGPTPQLERAIRSALDSFPEIAVCNHEEALLSACLDPPGERGAIQTDVP